MTDGPSSDGSTVEHRSSIVWTERAGLARRLLELDAPRIDLDRLTLSGQPTHNPNLAQSSEALAYIMYTSGSTGMPKGVLVPHRGITRLVLNNGYDFASAQQAIASGAADAVAFGRALLANPDLVERFRRGAPLNQPDYEKLYVGEEKGYTDYPVLPA